MNPLHCLPREIWLHINSFVPVRDTFSLMLTCRGTKGLAEVSLRDRVNQLIEFWYHTHSDPEKSILGYRLLVKWIRVRHSLNTRITFSKLDAILQSDRLAWSVITGMYPQVKTMRGKHPSGREWPRLLMESEPNNPHPAEKQSVFFVLNELARVNLAVPFNEQRTAPRFTGNYNPIIFTKGPKEDELVINYLNTEDEYQMMKMVQQIDGNYSYHHLVQRAFTGLLPYAREGERVSFHDLEMKESKRRWEERYSGSQKRSRTNPKP